nr:immunoglobulin heavy chain junction region [Mus musculus]
LTSEDSA